MTLPKPVLIDKRNFHEWQSFIIEQLVRCHTCGFDIETQDASRHSGLNAAMGIKDPEKDKCGKTTPLVFDNTKTVITGFSLYPLNCDYVFYINLNHEDTENRLSPEVALQLLNTLPAEGRFIAHNAPFEIMQMKAALGYDMSERILCSMQLLVSCYGPDEFDPSRLREVNLGKTLKNIQSEILRNFSNFSGKELNNNQAAVLNKFVGKTTDAEHSYTGMVKPLFYGYGLKQAVKSWFNHDMVSFEQTLGNRVHMGQLTGDEVFEYGCDDAYWCVRLYLHGLSLLNKNNPKLLETFFRQEQPMVPVYADVNLKGIRVDVKAIYRALALERKNYVACLRSLKNLLRQHYLHNNKWPHSDRPEFLMQDKPLMGKEKLSWYVKNGPVRHKALEVWLASGESLDDFEEAKKVDGSVTASWSQELGVAYKKTLNLTHYMTQRVIIYDLLRVAPLYDRDKKLQSDSDARNLIYDQLDKDDPARKVIEHLNELADIEQRMKLYIVKYFQLVNPHTGRMYGTLSSRLASRRMAGANPNLMQLSKTGKGAYVRSFFLPDDEDSVIISLDWSQIELVLIAEESQDPEFLRCYSQVPYEDLHKIAMATCYQLEPEEFDLIKSLPPETTQYKEIRFIDQLGNQLTPKQFYKFARTNVGKVANFNYWYSGALASVGEQLGISSTEMWELTERYRTKFIVAEGWRQATQQQGSTTGFVTLRDGHRRVRYEATEAWANWMYAQAEQTGNEAIICFIRLAIRKIQARARNQFVNSLIQGGCATLAKRSIIRFYDFQKQNPDYLKARFLHPIHDELVFSVNKDSVLPFLKVMKPLMLEHKEIVPSIQLDCSASMGLNFQPFDQVRAPLGQFELDECHEVSWMPKEYHDKKLDDAGILRVLDYMLKMREALR